MTTQCPRCFSSSFPLIYKGDQPSRCTFCADALDIAKHYFEGNRFVSNGGPALRTVQVRIANAVEAEVVQ